MRTIVLVLAATSALALTAQQANAQDFTGPRAEVSVGYDSTNSDDGVSGTPNKLDGVRVGGAIGYDVALGDKITLGAEAGIGFIASGDARYTAGITGYRLTTGRDLDLSLRVGYKVAPRTLIYAKGGWANSQYRARLTGGTQAELNSNEDGWRIGAGLEQSLGNSIYAKAEYRYTNYGDDVSRHQVLAGLGYRF